MMAKKRERTWRGFKFRVVHGDLNLVKPDFYEGIEGYGNRKISKRAMETVLADWIDISHRSMKLLPEEIKAMKKFSEDEQRKIFGYTIMEAKKKLKEVT